MTTKNRHHPLEMEKKAGDSVRKKIIFVCLLLFIVNILTACWSYKELTDIAFVTAIGIDVDEKGKYLVTFQLINPRNVFASQHGGVQGLPVTVYEGKGDTIYEAARKTSQHVSRILYFSHTNLVVIGEELAKRGIIEIFDVLERSTQFRITARVVIAKGTTASELLQILAPLDQISANKIIKTIEFSQKTWGKNIETDVAEIIDNIYSEGSQPVISGMFIEGDKEKGKMEDALKTSKTAAPLSADGIAVFKDGKLVTWAEEERAWGIAWIRDRIQQTIVNIDWEGEKEVIAFRVIRAKTKIQSKMKNGQPEIHIHIDAEGSIGETHVPVDLSDGKELKKLEKTIAQAIQKEVEAGIDLAKKEKSDILNFGKKVSVQFPQYWKENKHIWDEEILPEIPVNVNVHAFVRRTELRLKPYFYELKKHGGAE